MRNTVIVGNCLDAMRSLPADSVDAVVTDPPYELGFMGKSWDSAGVSYDPATWAEALRVLKPGGHLLAFGGSRTYHRIAVAIEDAGFEIRDSLMWIYGSGFPKSLDVSKAMDKRRNDKAAKWAVADFLHPHVERHGFDAVSAHFGVSGPMVRQHWCSRSQTSTPTWDQWLELQRLLGFGMEMDATVRELNGLAANADEAWAEREVTGAHAQPAAAQQWKANNGEAADLTAKERRDKPATEEAKRWEGWGTALKPAHEPIVLARKPLIGTVAENVLAHGTGALNIDASRIAYAGLNDGGDWDRFAGHQSAKTIRKNLAGGDRELLAGRVDNGKSLAGRWPANTLWDEEAAAQLDASTPAQPSRFFYVAKPGKRERNAGDTANTHPTVKPIALMRYLIKLVTPPGGVVLDPFLGSGSTACAAVLEGFDYIGIEQSPDYAKIAEARIAHWKKETKG